MTTSIAAPVPKHVVVVPRNAVQYQEHPAIKKLFNRERDYLKNVIPV